MNKWILLPAISIATLLFDQGTKAWVRATIPLQDRNEVIASVFNLVHVRNRGGAFGLLANLDETLRTPIFVGLSIVAVAVVLSMLRTTPSNRWGLTTALSLVLGGALGNLMDRLRLGSVVDFLDFYWKTYHWPAFNVADVAIVIGVALLLIDVFRFPDAKPSTEAGSPPEDRTEPAPSEAPSA